MSELKKMLDVGDKIVLDLRDLAPRQKPVILTVERVTPTQALCDNAYRFRREVNEGGRVITVPGYLGSRYLFGTPEVLADYNKAIKVMQLIDRLAVQLAFMNDEKSKLKNLDDSMIRAMEVLSDLLERSPK